MEKESVASRRDAQPVIARNRPESAKGGDVAISGSVLVPGLSLPFSARQGRLAYSSMPVLSKRGARRSLNRD